MGWLPSQGLTVGEVLRQRPCAAAVFHRRHLACPGCVMAPFDTLGDVAAAYHLDLAALLADLAEIGSERPSRRKEIR